MAIQYIDSGMRKVAATDYASTSPEEKRKLFTALNKQIFKNQIIDLLKLSNEALAPYLVEPVHYGEGWRNITLGLAEIEPYTDNPEARYTKTRNLLKDYVEEHKKTVRDLIRLTYNRLETQEYFKNTEGVDKLIQLTVKRITDTFAMRNYEFIKILFGATDADLKALKTTSEMYKLATEWKALIKNKITYTVGAQENATEKLITTIKETLQAMTIEPSDRFHADPAITKFPVSVGLSDLVLIMSATDKMKWDKFVSENQRNPEFYKLPEIEIRLLNIPSGTAYIQQKGQIEIAPHFEEQYDEFFPMTLDIDVIHHTQFKFGFSKIHNLVKIEKA